MRKNPARVYARSGTQIWRFSQGHKPKTVFNPPQNSARLRTEADTELMVRALNAHTAREREA